MSPEARAALLEALLALTRGDGPGELARYLDAFALEPGLSGPRRALVAIGRSRRAAGDDRTAEWIAATLDRDGAP